jgi:putative salt-induced outer membrane protein YdiY
VKKTIMNNLNKTGCGRILTLAAAMACLSGSMALAQEAPTPPPAPKPVPAEPAKKWETTAAAAITLTSGNSESFLATISLDSKRKWDKNEAAFGISGGYGENTVNEVNTVNTKFVQGFGQYNRLFTERFYAGLRLAGQYDGIAGVDYRITVSPLAGYYLIKNDKMTLAAEAGPSGVFEQLENQEAKSYLGIRFAERFEYKLTATTKIWETLGYTPQVDDWTKNYLMNLEVGIDTAISKKWSLRLVLQDMYASEPAPGKKSNDIRLLAGTAFKF